MYLGTVELCGCGGCHRSLLLNGEPLVALLSEHTISYSGYIADMRTITPSDIVLVMGGVRNSEELEIAREVARASRKVVAVGSCAVYAGVPGMRSLSADETGAGDREDLPELLPTVRPLDSLIDIDLYVPGCPPVPGLILGALKSLIEGYAPLHQDQNVCSECPRKVKCGPVRSWSAHPGADVQTDLCLLSSGFFCLGPVTRGGCHAACAAKGSVCIGCRGPSDMVLSSEMHSMLFDMIKFVSLSTGLRPEKVERGLSGLLRTIYLFTRADPVVGGKIGERPGL